MAIRKTILLPKLERVLANVGENIKLARLRRRLSSEQVSVRAGISKGTLVSVEKGVPGVAMGTYLQVLFVLGLQDDFLQLAADDILGRKLQDLQMTVNKRAPKTN